MNIEALLFYIFSSIAVVSGIMVISSRNPVHSVLFLVLVFCNAAGLLLLLETEFLAMLFLVVYVGAIAVLFLFGIPCGLASVSVSLLWTLRQLHSYSYWYTFGRGTSWTDRVHISTKGQWQWWQLGYKGSHHGPTSLYLPWFW